MPSSLTACPVCGYAGVMTAKRGGILNPGPRAQKAFVVLALGGTLLVRCGLQVVTHADDVANVAEITGDLDDLDFGGSGDDDDPYGDTLPQVEYDSPLYTAADGSFTVLFPGTGPIVEDTSESSDGTYELTLHQGDWHVRQITLPAALDPGPDAELPVLVGEISTTLAATVAGRRGPACHLSPARPGPPPHATKPVSSGATSAAASSVGVCHSS